MKLLLVLRICLYVQFLLGLLLGFGPSVGISLNRGVGDTHGLIGIVIGILALIALRPLPGLASTPVRTVARFFPLLPLVLGFGFAFGGLGGALVYVHMLLGIVAIGLVEAAAGQQKRARAALA